MNIDDTNRETTVSEHKEYGPWWKRVAGYLLRIVLPTILMSQLIGTLFFGRSWVDEKFPGWTGERIQNLIVFCAFLLFVFIAALSAREGQSWAHKLVSIRVCKLDGTPLTAGQMAARDLLHLLDCIFCLGFLWPLWDRQKQTFADKIMGTSVYNM